VSRAQVTGYQVLLFEIHTNVMACPAAMTQAVPVETCDVASAAKVIDPAPWLIRVKVVLLQSPPSAPPVPGSFVPRIRPVMLAAGRRGGHGVVPGRNERAVADHPVGVGDLPGPTTRIRSGSPRTMPSNWKLPSQLTALANSLAAGEVDDPCAVADLVAARRAEVDRDRLSAADGVALHADLKNACPDPAERPLHRPGAGPVELTAEPPEVADSSNVPPEALTT